MQHHLLGYFCALGGFNPPTAPGNVEFRDVYFLFFLESSCFVAWHPTGKSTLLFYTTFVYIFKLTSCTAHADNLKSKV